MADWQTLAWIVGLIGILGIVMELEEIRKLLEDINYRQMATEDDDDADDEPG